MGETLRKLIELIQNNTTFAIIVVAATLVIMMLSLTIIFYKINQKAWKGLIPIYNIMTLLDILGIPVWMILVMFIPFINIVGLPIMMFLIGWKLGSHCRKGIFMRLGLCLLPPLFIPLLSLCYIDIDGTGEYEYVEVEVPKGFSLDAVEVSDIQTNLTAMSLTDANAMEKIAPPVAIREVEIPKDTTPKKDINSVDVGASSNEIEDLNKVLPTADDLTFDYNSLYKAQDVKKEEIEVPPEKEEPKEDPLTPVSTKETTTLDYATLYKDTPTISEEKQEEEKIEEVANVESTSEEEIKEEPEEEEPKIVIHDVVLEAAEPITDPLGPVPINRRYDYQKKQTEVPKEEIVEELTPTTIEEEKQELEEINPLTPPVIVPIGKVEETPVAISPTVSVAAPITIPKDDGEALGDLPMQAANPFGDGSLPGLADIPEITLPTPEMEETVEVPEVNISEFAMQGLRETNVVEVGTRVDQIVSMNIAEPSQLPVGVLTRPTGKEEVPQQLVPEPIPEPVNPPVAPVMPQQPMINPNMTRAEAMGIRQTFFTDVVPSMPNPNMPNPMAQMQPQTNIFTSPMQPQGNGMVPGMNYGQQVPQMNYQQPMIPPQQPVNAAAIFQVNTPNGGSLLRPVDNKPAEKNCPVCGVKLKQECPICIMCGFKF